MRKLFSNSYVRKAMPGRVASSDAIADCSLPIANASSFAIRPLPFASRSNAL